MTLNRSIDQGDFAGVPLFNFSGVPMFDFSREQLVNDLTMTKKLMLFVSCIQYSESCVQYAKIINKD